MVGNLVAEIFFKVVEKNPHEIGKTVEQQSVYMLKAVEPVSFLGSIDPQEGFDINIFIHAFDIGKGMVGDIVFMFPHKGRSA